MGGLENEEPPRHASAAVVATSLATAILLAALLAKYAIDVLLIGLALLAVALLLHLLGSWLAESDLLSPGWFLAVLLALALGAWALLSPTATVEKLGGYVPRPIVKFVEWSESKGWANRVLFTEGRGGPGIDPAGPAAPAAVSPPSRSVRPPGGASAGPVPLTISASATTVRVGQPVVLTARLAPESGWLPAGTIAFYEGVIRLGEAPVVLQGGLQVASLTVSLREGRHDITAGTTGRFGARSEAVRVVVTP